MKTNPTRRGWRRRTREERAAVIGRYRTSGQTQRAFCQKEGIAVATLTFWLRQAREPKAGGPIGGGALVEVPACCAPSGEVVITLSDGVSVRAAAGTAVDWLSALIGALRCGA
jgi:transposase-like protein